jgi:hypothetical protein
VYDEVRTDIGSTVDVLGVENQEDIDVAKLKSKEDNPRSRLVT